MSKNNIVTPPKQVNAKEVIDYITSEENVSKYIEFFKDAIIADDNIIVKTIPRFKTNLFVPNEKSYEVRPEGIIVKAGANLSQDILGKTVFWDFERYPISMLSRISIDSFKEEDMVSSNTFIVIHKNIFTYIK